MVEVEMYPEAGRKRVTENVKMTDRVDDRPQGLAQLPELCAVEEPHRNEAKRERLQPAETKIAASDASTTRTARDGSVEVRSDWFTGVQIIHAIIATAKSEADEKRTALPLCRRSSSPVRSTNPATIPYM